LLTPADCTRYTIRHSNSYHTSLQDPSSKPVKQLKMTHHRMGESPSLVEAYNVCKSPNFQCLWKHQGNIFSGKPSVTNSAYEQHDSGNAHGCCQQQYVCKLEHYITRCLLEGGCFQEVWNMDEQLDAEGKSIQAESILQDRQQVFIVGQTQ